VLSRFSNFIPFRPLRKYLTVRINSDHDGDPTYCKSRTFNGLIAALLSLLAQIISSPVGKKIAKRAKSTRIAWQNVSWSAETAKSFAPTAQIGYPPILILKSPDEKDSYH
jgi:hypothetical protein